jgi:CubicO group peptidase (beta-lactamase class C family)
MAHTSGVRNDGGDEGPLLSRQCEKATDGLDAFKDLPLLFEPGGDFRYSSYGWILMSAAVEAAANEPFLSFMRTQVFEPLGMRDTEADAAAEPIADRATSYFPRFAADPRYGPDPMRPIDHSCYAGAAVFVSTPSDLVRFGIGINSGRLLQPATVQLLQTPQRVASGRETGYGLGWDVETAALAGKDTRWVGHEGTVLGGMVASLVIFPADRIVVSVASNTSYADVERLALNLANAFAAPETAPARQ